MQPNEFGYFVIPGKGFQYLYPQSDIVCDDSSYWQKIFTPNKSKKTKFNVTDILTDILNGVPLLELAKRYGTDLVKNYERYQGYAYKIRAENDHNARDDLEIYFTEHKFDSQVELMVDMSQQDEIYYKTQYNFKLFDRKEVNLIMKSKNVIIFGKKIVKNNLAIYHCFNDNPDVIGKDYVSFFADSNLLDVGDSCFVRPYKRSSDNKWCYILSTAESIERSNK